MLHRKETGIEERDRERERERERERDRASAACRCSARHIFEDVSRLDVNIHSPRSYDVKTISRAVPERQNEREREREEARGRRRNHVDEVYSWRSHVMHPQLRLAS